MGGQDGRSRYVDYNRIADRYRQGRALPPAALDRWREAVLPHLPPRRRQPLRVADIGAGTGIFAAVWPHWISARVIAVEPNQAMILAGPPEVDYLQATAEALPLATASVDVVWLSTAVHHFTDLDRATGECVRVLQDPGCVLLRTFLPERTEVSWIGAFPGYPRALARFPTLDRLAGAFRRHGLLVSHVTEVTERRSRFASVADWVAQMRHADSMLTALSDEEIVEGLRVLRAQPNRQAHTELSLVVLTRLRGRP